MQKFSFQHTVADRFLRYVQIDTEADHYSTTSPSTEKQKNLSRLLAEELVAMGISDAHTDEYGYVYATIPATTIRPNVPVLCFCAHVDTAPDCSGKDVKPILHRNYQGQDITLPDDPTQVISPRQHTDLAQKTGEDIITASGLTLLGADDKAGVAEIMDAAYFLINNPQVPHGKIRILFTTDEEVGRGVDHVDMKKLGADFGYTLDGGKLGTFENENFSADNAVIAIRGVSAHPGYAKGKMENAIKIAADIVAALPRHRLTPETTHQKQGFIHPTRIEGGLENAAINLILRDFDDQKLADLAVFLQKTIDKVMLKYPNSLAEMKITPQYRNMKQVLDQHPQVTKYAMAAIQRSGVTPRLSAIRGGTDGSRLSFMGMPCPNLFAGEQAIHSRHEWVSVQDMEKAVQTIVHLCMIWEENS